MAEALKDTQHTLIVVGSGVSMGASPGSSCASWTGLIEDGIDFCLKQKLADKAWADFRRLQLAQPGTDERISAAEQLQRKMGGPQGSRYADWLEESVGALRLKQRDVVDALHAFGTRLATTNYDGLLEEATGLPPVTWRNAREVERALRSEPPAILHLHGHWKDPESVILGIRDYERVLNDKAFQQLQAAIGALGTLVFVGSGLDGMGDPNVGALFEWLLPLFSRSRYTHYLLLRDNESAEAEKKYPPTGKLRVVGYGAKHSDLAPFLRRLAQGHSPGGGGGGSSPGGGLVQTLQAANGVLDSNLRFLLRRARRAPGMDPRLREYADLYLPRPYADTAELAQLATLLRRSGLSWEKLSELCRMSLSEACRGDFDQLRPGPDMLEELVDILSEMPSRPYERRTFPLLEFALRVSKHPEELPVRAEVRTWFKRAAKTMGVAPESVTLPVAQLPDKLHLLVKIEPLPRARFSVQAWLDDGGEIQTLQAETRCTKKALPGVLWELRKHTAIQSRLHQIGRQNLMFEFILPRELLLEEVEHWVIEKGSDPVPIGIRHPVVVRSLERIYAEVRSDLDEEFLDAATDWRQKWQAMQALAEGALPVFRIASLTDLERTRLLSMLLKKEIACVALELSPSNCPVQTRRDVLKTVIGKGIPIALWTRGEKAAPTQLGATFERLLTEVLELPSRVLDERLSAFESNNPHHAGQSLTLLFDSPDRVPPDAVPGWDYHAPGVLETQP
ncbi:VMAP-C domain-containing protein [Hyalangium versicolor]|uniref:VMAP-C domain-containing protein n=1 Tax=Hyalangium versicolor TaxID=2861190 RepID=UPI001CCBA3B8|nr:SIR2 family protein [Hyalangium versicolor]